MGRAQPSAVPAGRPPSFTSPSRARYGPVGRGPGRGTGLTSFPAAPRRLGRPRHSPALSSRFRRVSAGPRRRCPLPSASPPLRAPLGHPSGMLGLGGTPGKAVTPPWLHPISPCLCSLGRGYPPGPIPAEAPPSRGGNSITNLSKMNFTVERRFPLVARSFSQTRLSRCPFHAARDPRGSEGQGRGPWGRQWGCLRDLVNKAVSRGGCQDSHRGPGDRVQRVPAGRSAI